MTNAPFTVIIFVITQLFLGTRRCMRMAVTSFDDSDHFLNKQKYQYTGQDPQPHSGFVTVVMGVFWFGTTVTVVMMMVISGSVMVVRGQRMRDQVQKSVAQQSAGGEAEQDLQERLVFFLVLDGYEEEYEERQHADGDGGRQRFHPQHRVGAGRLGGGVEMVVMTMMMVAVVMAVAVAVTVTRAQFRQTQEDGHEQQGPTDVPHALLGYRHGSAS